jgi:DNA polymerase III alpha subunit
MDVITERIKETNKNKKSAQIGLFGEVISGEIELGELKLPKIEPASKSQRLAWEKELLGMYLSEHPLREIGASLRRVATHQIDQLNLEMEGKKIKICGILTSVKKINTRNGEPMLFAGIEDLSGKTEILVFPKLYKSNEEIWHSDSVLIVSGKVSTKEGEIKILADKVEKYDPNKVKEIPEETIVTVSDEDEIVEIDLDEEPEAQTLSQIFEENYKKSKFTIEHEGVYYIILPKRVKKDNLVQIKQLLLDNLGDVPVELAYKQNGEYKTKKTSIKINPSTQLSKNLSKILE